MSLIFDALQRSEGERSGNDLPVVSAAAEFLQRLEHQTLAEREVATLLGPSDTTGSLERDVLFSKGTEPSTAGGNASIAEELVPSDRRADLFAKFQQLQVSPQSQLACFNDSESLIAEKFRFLGVRLRHLRRERSLKKVLITSTIPREGKSTVSANLACTLAQKKQRRTLLLEGDVRRPSLSQLFGLARMPGLCELLQRDNSEITNIYHLEGPDLWLLPAGSASGNPLELLQSGRLSALMDQLASLFDWIIIDSPPVLPLADTSVWARLADGILLVTRQGITEKRQLEKGLEALDHEKMIGALLNCSHSSTASEHYYYYRPSTASGEGNSK